MIKDIIKNEEIYKDLIEALENTEHLCSLDYEYAIEDSETFDDFLEYMQELIGYSEIVYYSKAIKYLSENDPSLRESLGIAQELGYDIDSISSETLASLLLQEAMNAELSELDKFDLCFEQAKELDND